MAIEEITEPEDLCDEDRIIKIIQYFPENNTVSQPKQVCSSFLNNNVKNIFLIYFFLKIFIKKTTTMSELQTLLASHGNFNETLIKIAKPYSSTQTSDPNVVSSLKWRSYVPPGEKGNLTLDEFSWMVFDADSFVFKDSSMDEDSETSEAEESNSPRSSKKLSSGTERSLKIQVIKDNIS